MCPHIWKKALPTIVNLPDPIQRRGLINYQLSMRSYSPCVADVQLEDYVFSTDITNVYIRTDLPSLFYHLHSQLLAQTIHTILVLVSIITSRIPKFACSIYAQQQGAAYVEIQPLHNGFLVLRLTLNPKTK